MSSSKNREGKRLDEFQKCSDRRRPSKTVKFCISQSLLLWERSASHSCLFLSRPRTYPTLILPSRLSPSSPPSEMTSPKYGLAAFSEPQNLSVLLSFSCSVDSSRSTEARLFIREWKICHWSLSQNRIFFWVEPLKRLKIWQKQGHLSDITFVTKDDEELKAHKLQTCSTKGPVLLEWPLNWSFLLQVGTN